MGTESDPIDLRATAARARRPHHHHHDGGQIIRHPARDPEDKDHAGPGPDYGPPCVDDACPHHAEDRP